MPLYFLKISFAIFSSKENHLNSYYFIAIQTAPSCIKLQDKGTVSVNPKKNKGTVLLSLEVLRLLAEIAKLSIIIIVAIPQEVKDGQKGRERCVLHLSLGGSVGQDRRTVPLSSAESPHCLCTTYQRLLKHDSYTPPKAYDKAHSELNPEEISPICF